MAIKQVGTAASRPQDAVTKADLDALPGGSGGGDASTNTATSVDNELALFSGSGGKTLKRATQTGILKAAAGVLGTAAAGTDYQAPITLTTTGTSGAATFSGGTLNIPQYTGGGGSSLTDDGTGLFVIGAGSSLTDDGTGLFVIGA